MTIAEVSKKYDISADTLRYYERIGLIPPVPRKPSGIRDYDEESCQWVGLMKCMRKAGVQIEALIEYVELFRQGDETINARKTILIEQKKRLVQKMNDMQETLERLNDKIEKYEQGKMTAEHQLKEKQKACLADTEVK
ncbi:MerR family transcriptional regulator [Anaerostipes sp.]|uniref:MerR family transcriptional regulator n=1 Tax=Anaerostipes sp. TaxID=1872530 RepID=UPI0025BA33E9|nr:MerR family transcriptional regulator [Anaerostipes sp.]MBS7009247.1 MerR family transcriptional regulator [Anaerostipes sp.]